MVLKAIELFGFKTFAERTRLEFGEGITAIIGPNGVGKTNLVEAFLWVLGEVSPRALRTSRASELIFNGSGGRRPLSFAEVSLHLDNSEGLFPLPFSEVVIARRVLRSGESQYLLNGAECRARDVLPLLVEGGISSRTFVVLTQGELEAVLSQHPQDRRALLESLSGAARYRLRREEALSKLEATETDIQRLSDIVLEVEGQLERLREQAEKADRYKRLSREREESKALLLTRELLAAGRRRSRLAREVKEREEEIVKEREKARRLEAEMEKRREEWRKEREEAELLRLQAQQASLRAERKEGELSSLRERVTSLQREGVEAAERGRRLRVEAEKVASEIEELSQEIQFKEGMLLEEERSLREAEEEAKRASERASRARKRVEELSLLRLEEAKRVEALRREVSSLKGELYRIEGQKGEAKKELESRERRKEGLTKEEETLRKERERLIEALGQARKESARREEELKRAVKRLTEAEREMEEAKAKLKAVEAEEEGVRKSLEALLPPLKSSKRGIKRLADVLRVEEGKEAPVGAVLGRWLRATLADSPEEAVRLFRQEGAECVVLLKGRGKPKPPEGFEELASHARGEGRDVLGGILLCPIGKEEEALLLSLHRQELRFVAEDGSFVVERGVIYRPEEGREVLILKSRAEELARSISVARERLARWEEEVSRHRREAEKEEKALREAREEEKRLSERASKLEGRLSYVFAELEREEEGCQREKERLTSLAKEEEEVRGKLDRLLSSLKEAEEREERARRAVSLALEEEGRLRAEAEEKAGRASSARASLERLKAELEGMSRLKKEREERLSTLLSEAKEAEEKAAFSEVQVRELRSRLGTMTKGVEKARNEALYLSGEAEGASRRAEKLAEETASGEKELRASLERGARLQEELGRLKARIAQSEAEEEALKRRLEEMGFGSEEFLSRAKRASVQQIEERLSQVEGEIEALGAVNLAAAEEFERTKERLKGLLLQREDLVKAKRELEAMVKELDQEMEKRFREVLSSVADAFDQIFRRLFGGGETRVVETEPKDGEGKGVDIEVRLPGRRRQNMLALSGGERALTALAFLFSLLKVRPVPFCVLDEVDATLDEANTEKFVKMLREFSSQGTQFVIVTHNRGTMEAADCLYGVTMEEPGLSKVMSVRLDWAVTA